MYCKLRGLFCALQYRELQAWSTREKGGGKQRVGHVNVPLSKTQLLLQLQDYRVTLYMLDPRTEHCSNRGATPVPLDYVICIHNSIFIIINKIFVFDTRQLKLHAWEFSEWYNP